ncbi:hypothetical protein ACROYT_G044393 [Oculina patagonica]
MASHRGLVERLTNLVDGLREQNRAESQRDNHGDINESLSRLFPSTRRNAGTSSSATNNGATNGAPLFNQWSEEAKPKRSNRRRQPYPKCKATKTASVAAIKDIILLPNPNMASVPRGRKREELYVRKLVATAFEIYGDMTSSEIYDAFASFFSRKLKGKSFEIVRAVGNKIISPNISQGVTGRVLKHLTGQGPVYLRCKSPIETDYAWATDEESDESDGGEGDSSKKEESTRPRSGSNTQSLSVSDDDSEDEDPKPMLEYRPPPTSARRSSSSSSTSTTTGSVNIEGTDNHHYSSGTSSTTHSLSATLHPTCPTCNMQFPLSEIEVHADICCENMRNPEISLYESIVIDPQNNEELNSEPAERSLPIETSEEVSAKSLLEKCSALVKKPAALIFIRRKFIWEDYMEAREKPWVKPENGVRVQFVGEPAVDGGGPGREFFTEIIEAIKTRLFIEDDDGYVPVESTMALANGAFKTVGEIFATSIVQGGPGPGFLAPWVFHYICHGMKDLDLKSRVIKDEKIQKFQHQLNEVSSDEELQNFLQEDASLEVLTLIGYRGVPSREKLKSRPAVLKSLLLKSFLEPKIAMIEQMAQGLSLFGVLDAMRKHSSLLASVFTPEGWSDVTCDELMQLMIPDFSDDGTRMKELEVNAFKYFADFITSLHYEEPKEQGLSVKDVMKFITGTNKVPPLGFPKKINVSFIHGCEENCRCRPTSSTCDLRVNLPVHYQSYDVAAELFLSALRDCQGFGRV